MEIQVNILMKIPFDKIIEKYGVKIWNGDKVCGSLITMTETHVTIVGKKSGSMEDVPHKVSIEKNDIKMVYNLLIDSHKINVLWKENNSQSIKKHFLYDKYEMISHNLLCYSLDYTMSKPKPGYEDEWAITLSEYEFIREILGA